MFKKITYQQIVVIKFVCFKKERFDLDHTYVNFGLDNDIVLNLKPYVIFLYYV